MEEGVMKEVFIN